MQRICKNRKLLLVMSSLVVWATSFGQQMKIVAIKATPATKSEASMTVGPACRIEVRTTGDGSDLTLLQFSMQAKSSKNGMAVAGVKAYYSGTRDEFDTTQVFASVKKPGSRYQLTGTQTLQAGTNYFWLVYEPATNQVPGRVPEAVLLSCTTGVPAYRQVWADEFNRDGQPDPANWVFEKGYVRNEELQWYGTDNAVCQNGILTIEARRDNQPNPLYEAGSREWRKNRPTIEYTASSINTSGKHAWTYGRFEMRARLDTNAGCWPAWWCLGTGGGRWPDNGEIDMMEYYRGKVLANYAVGTQRQYNAKWYSVATPVEELGKQHWADSFHNWRMDWDSAGIAIYLDNRLLNYQPQALLYNRNGNQDYYPFRHPQYMLLNFAIGGQNGGDPSRTVFPRKYEIDYVRVAQQVAGKYTNRTVHKP